MATSQRCRLLELPRELRDKIYNLALTYEEGLLGIEFPKLCPAVPEFDDGQRNALPTLEVNQLKYTCHQLYHETRGLALRLNDTITFRPPFGVTDLTTFLAFAPALNVVRCGVRKIKLHQNVAEYVVPVDRDVLRDEIVEVFNSTAFSQVVFFSQQHPEMIIYINFRFHPGSYRHLAITYTGISKYLNELRGLSDIRSWTPQDISFDDMQAMLFSAQLHSGLSMSELVRPLPHNLRVTLDMQQTHMLHIKVRKRPESPAERAAEVALLMEKYKDGC